MISKGKRKNFKELKWRNRWNQLRIASRCPIAPLKKRSLKVGSNNNIPNSLKY
jgi:hypothetical protein